MFDLDDSTCFSSDPLIAKESISIQDPHTIWDFLADFYKTLPELCNGNSIRPGKTPDIDLARLFDEKMALMYPNLSMDRCWSTFMVSMFKNFGESIFDKPYTFVVSKYLSNNELQYPTLLWLHHACAYTNGHLSTRLYAPKNISTDLLKQTALWLAEANDVMNDDDCIDINHIWDTKFGKHFRLTIRPYSFFKYNHDQWNDTWLSGIIGILVMLGLADVWQEEWFGNSGSIRYVRPSQLLLKAVAETQSSNTALTVNLEPHIIFDDQRAVARFTDPVGRAILVDAGARLISQNRVTLTVEDLAKSAAKRALKTTYSRFLKMASVTQLPPVWEKLFEDASEIRESIVELDNIVTLSFKTQDDYDRFRKAIQGQGAWTRHIIHTGQPIILVENSYAIDVLNRLSALGIKL